MLPLGGVAQVIFHGVQVVEVGVQVRGASGQRSGRRRGRTGRSRKGGRRGQREPHIMDDMTWSDGHMNLSQCGVTHHQ